MAVPLYIFCMQQRNASTKFNDAWHIDAEVIFTTAYDPLERAARVGLGLLTRLMHANNS